MSNRRVRHARPPAPAPATHEVGDVVTLHAPRGASHVTVHAPDGLQLAMAARNGTVDLWLAQPGTWRYSWGSDLHEINVVEPEPAPEPARRYTGPGA